MRLIVASERFSMTRSFARHVRRVLPHVIPVRSEAAEAEPKNGALGWLLLLLAAGCVLALVWTAGLIVGAPDRELMIAGIVAGGGLCAGIGLVVLGSYLFRRSGNERFASSYRDARIEVDDEGIVLDTPRSRSLVKWSGLDGWVEADGFIAWYATSHSFVVPDDALRPDERATLLETFAARIHREPPPEDDP